MIESRKQFTELLGQIYAQRERNIYSIFTTEKPWLINAALRRRLERRIFVNFPEKSERIKFISNILDKISHQISTDDLDELGDLTERFSLSDLDKLIKLTVEEFLNASLYNQDKLNFRMLDLNDFKLQIKQYNLPEYTDSLLMEQWISDFGE